MQQRIQHKCSKCEGKYYAKGFCRRHYNQATARAKSTNKRLGPRLCNTVSQTRELSRIGEIIRDRRVQLNLTQDELCHRAGLSHQAINSMGYKGSQTFRLLSLELVAQVLDIPVYKFFLPEGHPDALD